MQKCTISITCNKTTKNINKQQQTYFEDSVTRVFIGILFVVWMRAPFTTKTCYLFLLRIDHKTDISTATFFAKTSFIVRKELTKVTMTVFCVKY